MVKQVKLEPKPLEYEVEHVTDIEIPEGNNYKNNNHTDDFIYLLKILHLLGFNFDCKNLFK